MNEHLCFSGEAPEHFDEAFALLAPELGFVRAGADELPENGQPAGDLSAGKMPENNRPANSLPAGAFPVTLRRGDCLRVEKSAHGASVTWAAPVQAYRALGLLRQHWAEETLSIEEHPCFETAGVMFDVSRNAVLLPQTLQYFLRKMALMGLNLGMMYTEDTYEVPEQPYFGYQRGRYSIGELRALDDYAHTLGIELCPCIQTLGHMNRALHWPKLAHLKDNEEVLLADDEATYAFIEQLIAAACAPYRSKRIHIGMDEAHGIGLGAHLRRHGFEDPHVIIRRHLARVLEITRKHGLSAMMWSDMFFRPDSPTNGYYDTGMPTQKSIDAVPPDVTLVYWDYYHESEQDYAEMLAKHAALPAPTVFTGGVWTFCGPALDYAKTVAAGVPALTACKKAGVPLVLAAAWGDNGAEANLLTALLAFQLYAEFTYTGVYDETALAVRFACCCGADAQAFLDLSLFNTVPGMRAGALRPVNAAKFLLYQDPLIQLYEEDTADLAMSAHYAALEPRYQKYASENPAFAQLFSFYALLARVLARKCAWHEQAGPAVREHDLALAAQLAGDLPETIRAVEALRCAWRALWESTNRPHGFEIIDLRLGGVAARLSTAAARMQAFAAGETADIPELSAPALPYTRMADGALFGSYAVGEIVSACKIDI